MTRLLIKDAKALVGVHPADVLRLNGAHMARLPVLEDAWLLAEDGRITAFGTEADWPGITDWNDLEVVDAAGRYVLPGWCDSHSHVVHAASRESEFVDRINGLDYQSIAARGGGILNSARRLRAMDEDELFERSLARVRDLMALGTVALEIKSGYGLTLESELKMLRVARRIQQALPLQVRTTLLAAHAIPEEFKHDRTAYLDLVVNEMLPAVAAGGLADFVDCFCETNYFTVAEMVRILEAGRSLGLPGKVHVNQFTSIGGLQAAVEQGALSVDHLEVMEEADIAAVAGSGTIATLLPSCSFFLRIPYAPARTLLQQGAAVALASDMNPGTTPSGNMNMVVSLGCIQQRMLPEEAINAATLNGAAAMGLSTELGAISIGRRASLIITRPVPSLAYLPYAFGTDHIDTVIIDGTAVRRGEALA